MDSILQLSAAVNIIFLLMHEFDAFEQKEWKMFSFLRPLGDRHQYLIFLYAHIPLCGLLFYYLWTVIFFNNFYLWIIVNSLSIIHLIIHIIAYRWKSNVFYSFTSYFFITGAASAGAVNLVLSGFYKP